MLELFFISLVTLFRILPHAPNFTPMGAVALMAGRHLDWKRAVLLSLSAMLVSDLAISYVFGYRQTFTMITVFVYGSFALQSMIAYGMRRWKGGLVYSTLAGATVFFLLSNFGVWLEGLMYSRTLGGLLNCYAMALPFFKTMLIGDLLWVAMLTAGYVLYRQVVKSPETSPAV